GRLVGAGHRRGAGPRLPVPARHAAGHPAGGRGEDGGQGGGRDRDALSGGPTMTAIWVPLAWLAGAVALLGWMSLMVWMTNRGSAGRRRMALEARSRRLELQLPEIDPEQARGERERQRTLLIGLTGILVPLGVCAALVVLTVLGLESRTHALSLPLLL